MSGNIQDTNVTAIKKQINDLVNELRLLQTTHGDSISDWRVEFLVTLQRKYKQLYSTSNTLFKFIVTNYGTSGFNESFFNQTIDLILDNIVSIQHRQVTQEDASANVGTHLANKFIPQINQK